MRFESVPVAEAVGAVLGHNVANGDGGRLLRKGTPLEVAHIESLIAAGRATVWVARLEDGDVDEDQAAARIAAAAVSERSGIRLSRARTGRVNLFAERSGVLRIDVEGLSRLNDLEGITLATLSCHQAVTTGKMVGTLKIIPYALAEPTVAAAERVALAPSPLAAVAAPVIARVGLVLSGSPAARDRVEPGFRQALGARLATFGASIERIDFVDLDTDRAVERLAAALDHHRRAGLELVILAGETAIMDAQDIAPRAVEAAGGEVAAFGAPVDPGNLLMLAYLDAIPVLGAPGCARSAKANVVDRVLPRLLVGDRLGRSDIVALGHGGLLEDVPERRMPRSWVT